MNTNKVEMKITGQLIDIAARETYPAEIEWNNSVINAVRRLPAGTAVDAGFICPGFVDAHVHIESSMLIPAQFARIAVVHGTVATVSDPHEIANVCGLEGVDFMIDNGATVPFHFFFGAPSCVPATVFETAGAALDSVAVAGLLARPGIHYLSEMMNFPGVLSGDQEVLSKIAAAKKAGKPVDGHAPGLSGKEAAAYVAAGMSTDHECFTAEEAAGKLALGMKILIREGSAARNFDALAGLIPAHFAEMMFCSDDKHPDSLVKGHINELCARAVALGFDLYAVLQMACLNPVRHYNLQTGELRAGDPANFIVLEDTRQFRVRQTYIDGNLVAEKGISLIPLPKSAKGPNRFEAKNLTASDLILTANNGDVYPHPVIGALDGQLITAKKSVTITAADGQWKADPANDILKIVVVNRYFPAPVAIAFINRFGLKTGALASSVAHDSHNIVAVGANDEDLSAAINAVIEARGGVSVSSGGQTDLLALPVAGLMSPVDGYSVAESYTRLDGKAKALGSPLGSPFMTLSFMALLVIPHLKISDLGLFDGDRFSLLK